ncbi:Uncharacterised protein [Vibrio cholerae]|nr:Uncharacterised protein [Vibrio cholerae]
MVSSNIWSPPNRSHWMRLGSTSCEMSRPVKRFMPLSTVSSTPNSVPIIQHSTHASLNLSTLRALIRLSTRFLFIALV